MALINYPHIPTNVSPPTPAPTPSPAPTAPQFDPEKEYQGARYKGSYGEGLISERFSKLKTLRDQARAGSITQQDYENQVQQLVSEANQLYHTISTKGSNAANAARSQWTPFVSEGFATETGEPFTKLTPFQGLPYSQSPSLQSVLQGYKSAGKGDAQAYQDLQSYTTTFQQMFKNFVGRDPTSQEYDQFLQNVIVQDQPWTKTLDANQLRQETQGVLSQFYTGTAEAEAQKKIQEGAEAAVAPGSPFEQWQQAYMSSLNDVEKSLTDFQSRLFEKIRPQLLTSLKAQNLLDTGALNTAFAGAASDLTAGVQNYMAQARGAAAQDIAGAKYQIQSQPYNYALASAYGKAPNLTQAGQTALQNVYGNLTATNLANLNYQHQRELAELERSQQPSLLAQYGGLILGGAAGGFGQGLGYKLGKG